MSSRQSRVVVIRLVRGNPVKLATHVNKGKTYPYMSERQQKRYARQENQQ